MSEKIDKEGASRTGVSPEAPGMVVLAKLYALAETPAKAMGEVYQSLAHSSGMLFENAVDVQQQSAITAQASTTQCVMALLGDGASVQNSTKGNK